MSLYENNNSTYNSVQLKYVNEIGLFYLSNTVIVVKLFEIIQSVT